MTFEIKDVFDSRRGCGWRKQGFYLRKDNVKFSECDILPLRLLPCNCCGLQIKLTRGLKKINVHNLVKTAQCSDPREECRKCLINRVGDGYLIGIGAKHYPSRDSFKREAMELGISKRIGFPLPRNFKVGESAVLLGHPKVYTDLVPEESIELPEIEIDEDSPQKMLPIIDGYAETTGRLVAKDIAAVIAVFIPERIEYVVGSDEPDEYLQGLSDQGVTLVKVHRIEDHQPAIEGV